MVSKLLTNFKRRQILNYIADSFAEEFDTLTANDGREGLATALDKTPDIIISDIMMPNMDGNKMCRMLKSDIRTSHIPIILLTAKDSLEAKEEGYDSGADTSTLYRKMKSMTGISTNEYIRKYKMQYAEHLLLEGKYTISEISFMVGMNSIAYFRKCFKDEYGLIPSEYLKKLKSENEGNE